MLLEKRSDLIRIIIVASIAAGFSLIASGHVSGFNNNAFHLNIIAGLWNDPQFASDAYIQSLKHFASGFWWPFAGRVTTDFYQTLFLSLAYLSRILVFIGFLLCASLLGVRNGIQQIILALLLIYPVTMRDVSQAGGGGLYLNNFTHSEVTNGTTLLVVYFAVRKRIAQAFAFNGLTFFINAFVAVWNAVPLGLILVALVRERRIGLLLLLQRAALGLVLFSLMAAPIVIEVLHNRSYGIATSFNYKEFLREYYAKHFLVDTISSPELARFAALSLTGLVAAFVQRCYNSYCLLALLGFLIVWFVGALLPLATDSPLLLNLHLLRVSSSVQIFATLAITTLTTKWLTNHNLQKARIFGPLAAFTIAGKMLFVPLMIPLVWAARRDRLPATLRLPRLDLVTPILILVIYTGVGIRDNRVAAARRSEVAAWRVMSLWVEANTPTDAVFMLPLKPAFPVCSTEGGRVAYEPLLICGGSEVFQFYARRRVWIDYKSGAAVMWSQPFYEIWHNRYNGLLTQRDFPARLAYALREHISYVIDQCQVLPETGEAIAQMVFSEGELCVYAVGGFDNLRKDSHQ